LDSAQLYKALFTIVNTRVAEEDLREFTKKQHKVNWKKFLHITFKGFGKMLDLISENLGDGDLSEN